MKIKGAKEKKVATETFKMLLLKKSALTVFVIGYSFSFGDVHFKIVVSKIKYS